MSAILDCPACSVEWVFMGRASDSGWASYNATRVFCMPAKIIAHAALLAGGRESQVLPSDGRTLTPPLERSLVAFPHRSHP